MEPKHLRNWLILFAVVYLLLPRDLIPDFSGRGLGLIDVLLCPHLDADSRRRDAMVSVAPRHRLARLGLDDCTALQVIDDRWRILSSRETSGALLVTPSGERREIAPTSRFRPLSQLV